MKSLKEDPEMGEIFNELEAGGPAAMMKYWNNPEVLKKLGDTMGGVFDFQVSSSALGWELCSECAGGAAACKVSSGMVVVVGAGAASCKLAGAQFVAACLNRWRPVCVHSAGAVQRLVEWSGCCRVSATDHALRCAVLCCAVLRCAVLRCV
jgi:hypothetical protein